VVREGDEVSLRRVPWPVAVVFGLGIVLRLALTYAYRPAFAGYPDAEVFAVAAGGDPYASIWRTAGYPFMLRGLHALSDELVFTTLVQHALGVVTAALLYAAVRRVGAGVWVALLPAAVVLFGGTQLYLEHSLLSDGPFTFVVVAGLWCATRALDGGRAAPAWLGAAALALGAAAVVRPAGLLLVPVLALWAALALDGRAARRVAVGALVIAVGVVPVAVYVLAQRDATGFTGMARADGWTLYARVAEFADCSKFDPPAAVRRVCESTPPERRQSANSYLYEGSYSPALRELGAPPIHNDELAAFARQAILHQPLDYARVVARDVVRAASPHSWSRVGSGNQTPRLLEYLRDRAGEDAAQGDIAAYWDTPGYRRGNLRAFDGFANVTTIEGPVTALLAVFAVLGVAWARGAARRVALLFALAAVGLLLAPAAGLFYDVRYATAAYPPLAAAAALGLQAVVARLRASAAPPPSAA
jgi:4-amino-4-deoxy-L-arabinose transferase-like glycosyltransferase